MHSDYLAIVPGEDILNTIFQRFAERPYDKRPRRASHRKGNTNPS